MNTLFQKMRNNRVKLEKAKAVQQLRTIGNSVGFDRMWGRVQSIEPYEEHDRKNKAARALLDSIR